MCVSRCKRSSPSQKGKSQMWQHQLTPRVCLHFNTHHSKHLPRSASCTSNPPTKRPQSRSSTPISTTNTCSGHYGALPYIWGYLRTRNPSVAQRRDTISDQELRFCASALRKIREVRGGLFFWVDAICSYADRYRTTCQINLRFRTLFSE